jgi:hypothetical protein
MFLPGAWFQAEGAWFLEISENETGLGKFYVVSTLKSIT